VIQLFYLEAAQKKIKIFLPIFFVKNESLREVLTVALEKGLVRIREKLDEWLKMKNWTHRQLSRELNCDESLVSQWHAKNPKEVSMRKIKAICRLTGLDVGEVVTFDRTIKSRS